MNQGSRAFNIFFDEFVNAVENIKNDNSWSIFGIIEKTTRTQGIVDHIPPRIPQKNQTSTSIFGRDSTHFSFNVNQFVTEDFFENIHKHTVTSRKLLPHQSPPLFPGTKFEQIRYKLSGDNVVDSPTDSLNDYIAQIVANLSTNKQREQVTLIRVQDLYASSTTSNKAPSQKKVSPNPVGYWINIISFDSQDALSVGIRSDYKLPFPQSFVFIRAKNLHEEKEKSRYYIEWEALTIYKKTLYFYSGDEKEGPQKPEIWDASLPIKDTVLTVDFLQVQNLVPISRNKSGGYTLVAKKPVYLFINNKLRKEDKQTRNNNKDLFYRTLDSTIQDWENYVENTIDEQSPQTEEVIDIPEATQIVKGRHSVPPSSSSISHQPTVKTPTMKRPISGNIPVKVLDRVPDDITNILDSENGCDMTNPVGPSLIFLIRESLVVEQEQNYKRHLTIVPRFIFQCIFLGLTRFPLVFLQDLWIFSMQSDNPMTPRVWNAERNVPKEFTKDSARDKKDLLIKLAAFSQSKFFEQIEDVFFGIHASEILKFRYYGKTQVLESVVRSVAYIYKNYYVNEISENVQNLMGYVINLTTDFTDTNQKRHFLTEPQYNLFIKEIRPQGTIFLEPLKYLLSCPWARLVIDDRHTTTKCESTLAGVVKNIDYKYSTSHFQDFFIENLDAVRDLFSCITEYKKTGSPAAMSSVMDETIFLETIDKIREDTTQLINNYQKIMNPTYINKPKKTVPKTHSDYIEFDDKRVMILENLIENVKNEIFKPSGSPSEDDLQILARINSIVTYAQENRRMTTENLEYLDSVYFQFFDELLSPKFGSKEPVIGKKINTVKPPTKPEFTRPDKEVVEIGKMKGNSNIIQFPLPVPSKPHNVPDKTTQNKSTTSSETLRPKPISFDFLNLQRSVVVKSTTTSSVFPPTEYMLRETELLTSGSSKLTLAEKELLFARNAFSKLSFRADIPSSLTKHFRELTSITALNDVRPSILDVRVGEYGHPSITIKLRRVIKESPNGATIFEKVSYVYPSARGIESYIIQ